MLHLFKVKVLECFSGRNAFIFFYVKHSQEHVGILVTGVDLTANHTAETSVTPVSQSAVPLPFLTGMGGGDIGPHRK